MRKNLIHIIPMLIITLSIISFGNPKKSHAQSKNNMKIKAIELKHTNPSMGPHETTTTITLYASENHLEKINTFLNNAKVNNTISLVKYLEAYQTSDIKTINKVMSNAPKSNAPKRELNDGQSTSNLTFSFEEGKSVTLNKYYLTLFYPNFSSYMVKHGFIDQEEPWWNNIKKEELIPLSPKQLTIDNSRDAYLYTNETLIIQLTLSPGGPGSSSYQLFVYGDGKCEFTGSSKQDRYSAPKNSINKTSFTKEEIKKILDTAKEINFIALTQSSKLLPHVDDGQQTTFGIWQDGVLRSATFGYGEYAMNKETKALADYILSLVEG
jgi:hypothetical protein